MRSNVPPEKDTKLTAAAAAAAPSPPPPPASVSPAALAPAASAAAAAASAGKKVGGGRVTVPGNGMLLLRADAPAFDQFPGTKTPSGRRRRAGERQPF